MRQEEEKKKAPVKPIERKTTKTQTKRAQKRKKHNKIKKKA